MGEKAKKLLAASILSEMESQGNTSGGYLEMHPMNSSVTPHSGVPERNDQGIISCISQQGYPSTLPLSPLGLYEMDNQASTNGGSREQGRSALGTCGTPIPIAPVLELGANETPIPMATVFEPGSGGIPIPVARVLEIVSKGPDI